MSKFAPPPSAGGATISYTPATVAGGAAAGAAAGSLTTTLSGTVSWAMLNAAISGPSTTLSVSSSGVVTTLGTAPSSPSGATLTGTAVAYNGAQGAVGPVSVTVSPTALAAGLPALTSASYAAVYGMHRMVQGYSSPVGTAVASNAPDTPTTTVDFSCHADGTPDLSAAVAAFGNVFDLYQLYDQTGNNSPAVQATAAHRYSITATRTVNGFVACYSGKVLGVSGDALGWLTLPNSIALQRQNFATLSALAGPMMGNAYSMMTSMGSVDVSASLPIYSGASGFMSRLFAGLYGGIDQNIGTFGLRSSAASAAIYLPGGKVLAIPTQTAASMTGGAIGQFGDYAVASGNGFQTEGIMLSRFCDIIFAGNPSDTDWAAVQSFVATRFSIPTRGAQIVVGADSIGAGLGEDTTAIIPGVNMWSYLQNGQLTRDPAILNFGAGGQTANVIANTYHTPAFLAGVYDATKARNIYFWMAGFNDLNGGATAATVDGYDATIIANAKAAGFTVVVASVISGGGGSQGVTLNNLRASQAASRGYTFVDFRSTAINTVDNIHPYSIGGYDNMAATAKSVLNAALA